MKVITTALAAILTIAAAACAFAQVTVELRPETVAMGESLRLEDIAYIQSMDKKLERAVAKVEVGRAPALGSKRFFAKTDLLTILKGAGVDVSKITLSGSEKTEVTRKSISISGEEILSVAKDYVISNMPWDESQAVLEQRRAPKDLSVGSGKIKYVVDPVYTSNWVGQVVLRVKVLVDEREVESARVSIKIRIYADAFVATGKIQKDQVIEPKDIVAKKVELTRRIVTDYASDKNNIIGKRVFKTVHPGKVIGRSMLGEPLLVTRDDIVTILARRGNIVITAQCKAVEQGAKGEIIKVKNVDSNKIVTAKIASSDIVTIAY